MTLEYNSYLGCGLGYIQIPVSDINLYGSPISVCFRGSSRAPGNAYFYNSNETTIYAYASCIDGKGMLYVTFFKNNK